jgi:enoyl-CoA hydratase/carnithine racemase
VTTVKGHDVSDAVRYERDGEVGTILLNSPEQMNTLSEERMSLLFDVLREANADPSTRVLIVTGVGPHFCAGGDINWEGELDEHSSMRLMRLSGHLSYELRNGPKPTIGAIRGYCLGGGNELNMHLDVTIASETAQFSQPETKWGLLPFWYTPQLLTLVAGERRAREVLLFGRMYSAEQALEIGLCNAVVPDDELESEARAWAEELLQRSPTALRLTKLALNSAADALRGAANHEAGLVTLTVSNERYHEEVQRFFGTKGATRRPRPQGPRVRRSSDAT